MFYSLSQIGELVSRATITTLDTASKGSHVIIEHIITQHAEEASFLWLLRDHAIRAPHYSLTDLAELDDRVEAHLDGLRIAGDAGWEMCKEGLGYEEAGEVFAAAILAFESEDAARIETVLTAGSPSLELSYALVSALNWLSYPQAQIPIQQLLNTTSPDLRRVGIAACAMHRQDPGYGLTAVLSDDDPLLKAQALRAIGELGRIDLLPVLQSQLTVGDDLCRYSAAWAAALLGDLAAITTLRDIARSDLPYREEAVNIALRRMEMAAARDWRQTLPKSKRPCD